LEPTCRRAYSPLTQVRHGNWIPMVFEGRKSRLLCCHLAMDLGSLLGNGSFALLARSLFCTGVTGPFKGDHWRLVSTQVEPIKSLPSPRQLSDVYFWFDLYLLWYFRIHERRRKPNVRTSFLTLPKSSPYLISICEKNSTPPLPVTQPQVKFEIGLTRTREAFISRPISGEL